MTADGSEGSVESDEDELKALAEAVAESKGAAIAGAGAALLVKVLTGSSIAAGAAEKAAAKVFGQWLADTPDARLQKAAEAFRKADQKQEALRAFGRLVEPLIASGLQSVQATALRIESGQAEMQALLAARAVDLEALLDQALRAIGLLGAGQGELKNLLLRTERAREAMVALPAERARVLFIENHLILPAAEGEPVRLAFGLANVGDLDAVVRIWDRTYFYSTDPRQTAFKFQDSPVEEISVAAIPSARWQGEMRFNLCLSPTRLNELNRGAARLFFYARGQYLDSAGKAYQLPFSAMYDPFVTTRLVAPPNLVTFV